MKKYPYVLLILILVISGLIASALLTRGHDWGDDFASYIMQAQSIVNGNEKDFVEKNSFTIYNSSWILGPAAYPWGYPLILALVYRIFGLNLIALKVPSILFFLLFLLCLFWLLRKRVSTIGGLIITALFAFSPKLLIYQDKIMPDIPFLFLSTLAVVLIDLFICENKEVSPSLLKNATLGAIIFLTTFFRPPGAVLLVMLLGCQIIHLYRQWNKMTGRRKILFNTITPYLVFGCLWAVTTAVFPTDAKAYISVFAYKITGNLKENIWFYYHLMESFLISLPSPMIIYGFLLAFFFIGIIARADKDYAFLIFSASMIVLLLAYPLRQGLRYIFPVIPFFVYFSFQGMQVGISGLAGFQRKLGLAITYLFWAGIIIMFLVTSAKLAADNLSADRQIEGPFDANSTEMFDYIKMNTPPNSVIVFFRPRAMEMLTGRDAIMIDRCDQLERGDYIVILKGVEGAQVSEDQFGSCGLDSVKVFENSSFVAYKNNK